MFIILAFRRRLVASLAQSRGELDRERKASEDLRREIQSYVNHVRQVESILARKVGIDFHESELLNLDATYVLAVKINRCPMLVF